MEKINKREIVQYGMGPKSQYDVEFDKFNLSLTVSNGMSYDSLSEITLNLDEQVQLFEILKDILEGE